MAVSLLPMPHAFAVHLHQHTVAGDAGGQIGFQGGDDGTHQHAGGILAAQYRTIILLRHLHALGIGIDPPGDDEGGDILAEQLLKALPPLVRRQAGEVGILHLADDLEPVGIKIVKKTGELQAGAVHILGADGLILIAGSAPQHLQVELFDQLAQFDGV